MKRGKFIVVEGGEGSGKTTLLNALRERYAGEKYVFTREPGGTLFAEALRTLMFDPLSKDVLSDAMMQLVCAARLDHMHKVLGPAREKGRHIFCDRFDSSTYAYQIFGSEGYGLKSIFWKLRELYKDNLPDLYIFLDIPPEKGIARVRTRNSSGQKSGNYFDEKEIEYHKRVYAGYKEFFKSVPHVLVDASRPLAEVKKDFLKVLRETLCI